MVMYSSVMWSVEDIFIDLIGLLGKSRCTGGFIYYFVNVHFKSSYLLIAL